MQRTCNASVACLNEGSLKPFKNLLEWLKAPIEPGACCLNQSVNCPNASFCHPFTHHIVASSAIRKPMAQFECSLQVSSSVRTRFGTKESNSQSESELASATATTTGNVSGNAVKSVSGLPTANSVPELPTANFVCELPTADFPCVNAAHQFFATKDSYHKRAVFRFTPASEAVTVTASIKS